MSYIEQLQVRNAAGTVVNPGTEETQLNTGNTVFWLKSLLRLLKPLSIVTGSGSNRLSVDINSVTTGNLSTINQVTAVQNQINMGNVAAFTMQQSLLRNSFANGIRKNLTIS